MFTDLDDFIMAVCDGAWGHWDANDVMTLMNTWQAGDISKTSCIDPQHRGDIAFALSRIKAKVLLMPATGDMLFTVRSLFSLNSSGF